MPYINEEAREAVRCGMIGTPGDLNYVITKLIKDYIDTHGLRYQNINDVLGALEGAKLEFYRRVAAPYEDKKIIENGDLYV